MHFFFDQPTKPVPLLNLNFAASKTLDPRTTFARASTGTYFDANGVMQTAAIDAPRFDTDPVTRESLGLLVEEPRTNLLLNSTIDGANMVSQSITTTAAARTLSFYGTGTVVLSGTHSATVVGSGAYPVRTTYTYTPTAGTLTLTVTGTVQYAQDELGAFATSFIPTGAASATRSADVASMTGDNFSSWYKNSAGVFSIQSRWANQSQSPLLNAQGPTINDRHQIKSDAPVAATVTNGIIASEFYYTPFAGLFSKNIAYRYGDNDFVLAQNGIITNTDYAGMTPTNLSTLEIGRWAFAGLYLNGCIKFLRYYPQVLSNYQLQKISMLP